MALSSKPDTDNVVLTVQNQEYSWTLPRSVKRFDLQARQARDVLVAFEANKTDIPAGGTPFTLKAGHVYYTETDKEHRPVTIYFRDASNAGTVVEILFWREVGP